MTHTIESFVQNVLSNYNIPLRSIHVGDTTVFDNNLRGLLFGEDCYAEMIQYITSFMHMRTACYWMDLYGCSYYLLNDIVKHRLILIGPFFHQAIDEQTMTKNIQHTNIPKSLIRPCLSILNQIPVSPNTTFLSTLINEFAHEIFQDTPYQWSEYQESQNPFEHHSYQVEAPHAEFGIEIIEKRYQYMQKLLFHVRNGNTEKAVSYLIQFQTLSEKPRLHNLLKDAHTWLITFHTSLRNQCEQCGIHPFYIDEISTKWFYTIETVTNPSRKNEIMKEMVIDYTNFISQHKQNQYSDLVQHAIIHIHQHMTQPISLSTIANTLNVSPAYLSNRFHSETNETITDFIHHTRIFATLDDLKNTNLSISIIGANIGYDDVNYYIRQFKKHMTITPAQYRKEIRRKHT